MLTNDGAQRSETVVEEKPQGAEVSTEQRDDEVILEQPEKAGDESSDNSDVGEAEAEANDSLEKILSKEEIIIEKVKKFPEINDGDVVVEDGVYKIKSSHVIKDINKIFGLDGETPDPKLFFSTYKNTPKKAEVIAKANGFRSSHYMKAALEDFLAAGDSKTRQQILKNDFPEHVWAEDVEPPYKVEAIGADTKSEPTVKGRYSWSNEELNKAVNQYVADSKVSKESILKSGKVAKLLGEFSGLQKDGKPISAFQALEYAVTMAGLKKEPLEKSKTVSAGGKQVPRTVTTGKSEVSPAAKAMADKYGYKF